MEKSLLDNLFTVNEKLGKIAEIVERHDSVTFPAITETLARMESKQNKDILQFHEAKGELHDRISPLEKDYLDRLHKKEETQKELKKIKWSIFGLIATGVTIGTYDHIVNILRNVIQRML